MAKSLRSKVKRNFRSKKREAGVYAAAHAARLQRLNAKLSTIASKDGDGDLPVKEAEEEEDAEIPAGEDIPQQAADEDAMQTDTPDAVSSKRISTHGPRGSRREEWRLSKGMSARPKSKGMNRQGGIAARRKAGRSKRRR